MNTPINPVTRLSPEKRNARLKTSFAKGDRVKESTRHPGEWLVSSSRFPNLWYRVHYDTKHKRYSCGCPWWHEKQEACRHLTRISWHVDGKHRAEEEPIAKAQ